MASKQQIRTSVTDLFNIKHPILLAGMGGAAGPKLAAAVTNAGGLGVIGGVGYSPDALREQIAELKSMLNDPKAPFGIDLLIPKVGGTARKTNYDYTKGKLSELIDVIIESGAKLFVSAIGIPPKDIVDRLHAGGVLYMNMIGHPKHVQKCLENDVDIVCAQGGEGGGHTGDVPLSVLIPAVCARTRGQKSKFTGTDVKVIAAGGIFSGEGLAAALMLGASAVWVGTRFVVAAEAGASKIHQDAVISASFDDTIRTIIFSGRPLRVRKTPYIQDWEENRKEEMMSLTSRGILPAEHDAEIRKDDDEILDNIHPFLMGVGAGMINKKNTAREIVDEMVTEAADRLAAGASSLTSKL